MKGLEGLGRENQAFLRDDLIVVMFLFPGFISFGLFIVFVFDGIHLYSFSICLPLRLVAIWSRPYIHLVLETCHPTACMLHYHAPR